MPSVSADYIGYCFLWFGQCAPLAFSSSASDGSSGFVRTSAQKGVATSTDLLVIAMPVATLAGVIIEGDWQGLKQGALSAVTALRGYSYIKSMLSRRSAPTTAICIHSPADIPQSRSRMPRFFNVGMDGSLECQPMQWPHM